MANGVFSDSNQMIKIDGDKIRRLRESKGLTQLYLATYVGVTTDTISRWENKRYQTIKQSNAIKLAEALEVDLDVILDTGQVDLEPQGKPVEQGSIPGPGQALPMLDRKKLLLGTFLFVFLLIAVSYFFLNKQPKSTPVARLVTAERIFPPHCAPNQLLPVR